MTEDERWDGEFGLDPDQRVRRFDFYLGTSLGTMYLDLHPRPSKYGHAAHFTVRCGCVTNGLQEGNPPEYQLPIVALVCNLSASVGSSTSVLTHSEVETRKCGCGLTFKITCVRLVPYRI